MRKLVLLGAALLLCVGVAEGAAIRRSMMLWTGAATDTTAVGVADSSSVMYTGDLTRLYLWLKPNRACRVAIQVRAHGDSTSASGTPALTDSTKTASWPWRAHVGGTGTLNTQVDSTVWIPVTAPTTALAGEDEYVVDFVENPATGPPGRGPRAKWISLAKVDSGDPYWGPNTSIRVRVLMAGGVVTWTGSLQGYGP